MRVCARVSDESAEVAGAEITSGLDFPGASAAGAEVVDVRDGDTGSGNLADPETENVEADAGAEAGREGDAVKTVARAEGNANGAGAFGGINPKALTGAETSASAPPRLAVTFPEFAGSIFSTTRLARPPPFCPACTTQVPGFRGRIRKLSPIGCLTVKGSSWFAPASEEVAPEDPCVSWVSVPARDSATRSGHDSQSSHDSRKSAFPDAIASDMADLININRLPWSRSDSEGTEEPFRPFGKKSR